ncbi:MAG TPA: Flp pilus assembly protein CpaB [Planctomycetales bacterium]|jgi:pilus assembly protein CpaB|nr:Flp pilus assembly protein CpaB [Planctomycetales bacterium]
MSLRSILIAALAVVFGGSAATWVIGLRNTGEAAPASPAVSVVVAAADVPRGVLVTADMLTTRDWPKELVPPGAITRPEDAVNRVALNPLVKDEELLDGKLAPLGAGRGLAALVPDGMRAFTIQTPNVASGVAGFILPGSKVDVLLTVSGGGGNDPTGGGSTTTLLQNVEILAVDQLIVAPSVNKVDPNLLRSVTLLVTPDQCAMLSLGMNKGTLQLSLRSPQDTRFAATQPTTMADLRLYQDKTPTPPPVEKVVEKTEPQAFQIRTLRGGQEGAIKVWPAGAAPKGQ